jgi:deoxycytidylate deaminase
MNHNRHLEEARAVSLLSDFDRVHIGCVITYNDKVIASGYNNRKTDPVQAKYNRYRKSYGTRTKHFCHAEVMALKRIVNLELDSRNIIVYNYRENADGRPSLSRPCPACMRFIKDLGIRRLIYSTDNEYGWCEERI